MAEDQAIREAKNLWEQKRAKEALLLLMRRVNELSLSQDDPP